MSLDGRQTGFAHLRGYRGNEKRFEVQQVHGHASMTRLPSASTCFNTLRLPAYDKTDILRVNLGRALDGSRDFDEGAVAV